MILLTGATGEIGPYVIATLHSLGHKVRTLSLDPPPANISIEGIEVKIGDVTNASAVQSAMQDVDATIHMAALRQSMNPTGELEEEYKRVNVNGTATVVEAAIKANVRRLVFFSTIHVYGDTNGQIVNELTTPQPNTLYGKTKLDAEQIVLSAKNSNGQSMGVVLRLAAVYGSRIKRNYRQLLMSLAKNRFIPIGQGENRRTLIYAKDVANAAALSMTHPDAAGQVFNVSDGKFHTMTEIITAMCHALGKSPPLFSLPSRPVRFSVAMVEDVAGLVGLQSPIVRAQIDKYTEDIAVDCQLIQTKIGFIPKYDLETGWRETVQKMRQIGDL